MKRTIPQTILTRAASEITVTQAAVGELTVSGDTVSALRMMDEHYANMHALAAEAGVSVTALVQVVTAKGVR